MRLQSKVLLLITPVIVLPLLVIGWFAYIKLTQTHNEEIFRQVDTAFDQIALHLNAHIEKTKANAVLLANSKSLNFLREQIDRARIGKIGYLMTTDTQGDVIYAHDSSENRCWIEASMRARLGEQIKSLETLPTRMCGVPVYLRVRPLAEGLWL